MIQDGKKSSPIRSDAYFPEWKPALTLHNTAGFFQILPVSLEIIQEN